MKTHTITPYLNEKNLKDVLEFVFETEIRPQTKFKFFRTFRVDYSFVLPHNNQTVFVEFNGPRHYTNTNNICRDYQIRDFCKFENIRLVEIPYFVQLNNYSIPQYFGWDVEQYLEDKEVITPIESGFHEKKIVLPWDFCISGLMRFEKDMQPISHVQNSNNKDDDDAEFWRTSKQIWMSIHNRPDDMDLAHLEAFLWNLERFPDIHGLLTHYPT